MDRFLTVKEFAERLGKSEETVKRYLRNDVYPEAKKDSDKIGWRIPEYYLNETTINGREIKKTNYSSSSYSDREIISLAYKIAFFCEPIDEIMNSLTKQGVKRALEIILIMRQNKKPIKNPKAFIQKAISNGFMPFDVEQKGVFKKGSENKEKRNHSAIHDLLFDENGELINYYDK